MKHSLILPLLLSFVVTACGTRDYDSVKPAATPPPVSQKKSETTSVTTTTTTDTTQVKTSALTGDQLTAAVKAERRAFLKSTGRGAVGGLAIGGSALILGAVLRALIDRDGKAAEQKADERIDAYARRVAERLGTETSVAPLRAALLEAIQLSHGHDEAHGESHETVESTGGHGGHGHGHGGPGRIARLRDGSVKWGKLLLTGMTTKQGRPVLLATSLVCGALLGGLVHYYRAPLTVPPQPPTASQVQAQAK